MLASIPPDQGSFQDRAVAGALRRILVGGAACQDSQMGTSCLEAGDASLNFSKSLVDQLGHVLARTSPLSPIPRTCRIWSRVKPADCPGRMNVSRSRAAGS